MTREKGLKTKNPLPVDSHSASFTRSGFSSEHHPAMDKYKKSSFIFAQDDD
jgi:hypothetical protein